MYLSPLRKKSGSRYSPPAHPGPRNSWERRETLQDPGCPPGSGLPVVQASQGKGDWRKRHELFAPLCGPAVCYGKALKKKKNNLLAVVTLYTQDWLIVLFEFILSLHGGLGSASGGRSLVGGGSAAWQSLSCTSPVPLLEGRDGCSLPPSRAVGPGGAAETTPRGLGNRRRVIRWGRDLFDLRTRQQFRQKSLFSRRWDGHQ